jgi:DNA-dependent RNA polymerase auxiliary subunit epsilon
MLPKTKILFQYIIFLILIFIALYSCKTKKGTVKQTNIEKTDTTEKCKLNIKSTKHLIEQLQKNTFNYEWIYAKAETKLVIDSEETDVDIKIRSKKDSAILITVEAINLFDVAKILITNDSVKMIIYPKKQYYYGSIDNISKLLNITADLDLIQSVLFGNNAEFYNEEDKVKLVYDKNNCLYLLTTTKKRKVKRLLKEKEILFSKEPIQIISIHPVSFKIIRNQFIDLKNNHSLIVDYENFKTIDSLVFPNTLKAKIVAQKPFDFNLKYSKVEINKPQNLSFRVPNSYSKIEIK